MDIRNTFEKVTSRLIISKINFDSFFWRVINLEFDLGILIYKLKPFVLSLSKDDV